MDVVILCGGRGTRLNGERPKPLMEIGGRPIVRHVVSIYAAHTPTGGRVHRVRDRLTAPFCLTYADGLADVDLRALRARHAGSGALATITVVRPELPFGVALLDGADRVAGFHEKPRADQWVNGGFMVLDPGALAYLRADSVLEREPLERLAADGALAAHRHMGFWRCLDTHKDAEALEALWASGSPPWLA